MDVSLLLEKADQARARAYAPYSGFRVGAALLSGTNRVFTGCNIENASYGLTVCAERVAVFNAVSAGETNFLGLALVCDGDDYCRPCGACLQVIYEFGDDILVIMGNKAREYQIQPINKLLPRAFKL